MTIRLIPLGDAHTGIKVGLWPSDHRDEYGKTISLGKSQKFIDKQLKTITKLAPQNCDEYRLVLVGDHIHGPNRENPREMDAVDGKTQCDAFVEAIGPLAARAESIYVIDDGSRFHVDDARFANDYIAQELGAFGKRAYPKLELQIEGLNIHIKHHGPALGYRPHTRGDPVRRYLRDVYVDALADGARAPDISIFAHWHQFFHESLRVSYPNERREIHAYFTPALCSADWRTLTRIPKVNLSDIGVIALDISGKSHVCHEWYTYFDNRVRIGE